MHRGLPILGRAGRLVLRAEPRVVGDCVHRLVNRRALLEGSHHHGQFGIGQLVDGLLLIADATLSPTGARAAFEARGDVFTVAAEDGSYRNITQSSGAHDRNPAWSPDGRQIAWFSDESGEYQLMIGDQTGATKPRVISLPTPAYFTNPIWSPNAKLEGVRQTAGVPETWGLTVSAKELQ